MNQRCLLTILIGGCVVVSSFAQDAKRHSSDKSASDLSVELNPVVVTGTGTHHRLKNTPTPVDVVTANDIKKAGITDFQQAMTMLVPSLSFSTNAMGSYLMMNGLSNKYVLVLINGKKLIGDTGNNVDLSRIDMTRVRRIEVLKGAGSALYGSDAIAGVINIITDQPQNALSVSSNIKYEEYGQYTNGTTVDVNIGMFGSQTAYTRQESNGWQINNKDEDGVETVRKVSDKFSSNVFNQKFTLDPSDALSLYVEGGYYDRQVNRPTKTKDVDGYDYDLTYDSYNLGIGGRYNIDRRNYIQFDLTNDNYDTNYKYLLNTGDYKIGDQSLTKRQHYYNGNVKGLFRFTENTRTIVGAEYLNETLERPSAFVDAHSYSIAGYAQEEMTLFNHLQAVVGLRYTHHSNAGNNVAPKASLMYQLKNFNIRAQYSGGFRAPGLDELYYYNFTSRTGTVTIGDKNLSAEKSHYGSINLEYFNNWLNLSVTGYVNSLRDMINGRTTLKADMSAEDFQAIVDEVTPIIGETNAGKIKQVKRYVNDEKALVKGFEINLNSNLGAGFSLGGSYMYAHAKNKDIEMGWRPIERSIRHSGSVNGNYTKSWNDYTLNVNLNGRIQSRRTHISTSNVDNSAPGYGLWNLSTRHIFSGFSNFTLEPGIGVNNIFDRVDNRPHGSNLSNLSPGRTVYVSMLIRFKK